MQLSSQFGTGITPYDLPAQRSVAPSLPKLNIRLPDDGEPDDEPTENKNPNTSDEPGTKTNSSPKSTSGSNSLWGDLKSIGEGAIGLGAAGVGAAKGLGSAAERDIPGLERATSGIEGDVINPIKTLAPEIQATGSKLLNGADYDVLQPVVSNAPKALGSAENFFSKQFSDIANSPEMADLAKAGEGFGTGAADVAPAAGAEEAVGLGPEDPFADIAAGATELGGGLVGAASRFF